MSTSDWFWRGGVMATAKMADEKHVQGLICFYGLPEGSPI
jgi:hypothetical protein